MTLEERVERVENRLNKQAARIGELEATVETLKWERLVEELNKKEVTGG